MTIDRFFTVVNGFVLEITEEMYTNDVYPITCYCRIDYESDCKLLNIYKSNNDDYQWIFTYDVESNKISSLFTHTSNREEDTLESNKIVELILAYIK